MSNALLLLHHSEPNRKHFSSKLTTAICRHEIHTGGGGDNEKEKLNCPTPTTVNGQILRKEKGRSTTSRKVLQDVSKMSSVNVCRKDTKKSDMDTVFCYRNLCKKIR